MLSEVATALLNISWSESLPAYLSIVLVQVKVVLRIASSATLFVRLVLYCDPPVKPCVVHVWPRQHISLLLVQKPLLCELSLLALVLELAGLLLNLICFTLELLF